MAIVPADASTPIRWGGTPANGVNTTSASFTAPSGALLVVCVSADTIAGVDITITVSDSGGLTWTIRAEADKGTIAANAGGHASVFTATTVSSVARTVSVQRAETAGTNRISVKCYVVTSQHATPTGASGQGRIIVNNSTVSVFTSTGENSYVFAAVADWAELGNPASSDMTVDVANPGGISVMSGYKDCGASGAETVNMDFGGTGTPEVMWAAVEIMAAAAAAGNVPYNPWPQRGPILAQKHKGFVGWNPLLDNRRRILRPSRGLMMPTRKLLLPRRFAA